MRFRGNVSSETSVMMAWHAGPENVDKGEPSCEGLPAPGRPYRCPYGQRSTSPFTWRSMKASILGIHSRRAARPATSSYISYRTGL